MPCAPCCIFPFITTPAPTPVPSATYMNEKQFQSTYSTVRNPMSFSLDQSNTLPPLPHPHHYTSAPTFLISNYIHPISMYRNIHPRSFVHLPLNIPLHVDMFPGFKITRLHNNAIFNLTRTPHTYKKYIFPCKVRLTQNISSR